MTINYGWVCPICNRGCAPHIEYCNHNKVEKTEVTFNPCDYYDDGYCRGTKGTNPVSCGGNLSKCRCLTEDDTSDWR